MRWKEADVSPEEPNAIKPAIHTKVLLKLAGKWHGWVVPTRKPICVVILFAWDMANIKLNASETCQHTEPFEEC